MRSSCGLPMIRCTGMWCRECPGTLKCPHCVALHAPHHLWWVLVVGWGVGAGREGLKKNSFAGGGGHSSPFPPPPPKRGSVTEPFSDISDSLLESESNKVGPPNKGGTSKRGALTNEKG